MLLGTVAAGGAAVFTLITQPPKPNCSVVLWPLASASVRLYCAQELADQPTLENLLEAIALVDSLDEEHPLRGAINPRIESWSKLLLDRAEETFHEGELERAIDFAYQVPLKTEAAKLIAERTSRWRRIWAEGEAIDARVAFALREENWRKAFGLMVDFLYVDNRYWSKTQYQKITDVIFQAQKDEKKVVEAEILLKADGFENLEKSLALMRELSANTIFTLSKRKIFNGVAQRFVTIAEAALEREALTEALDALSYIPRESKLWPYAQDLSKIANATSLTWGVSSNGYQRAIDSLGDIPRSSKLYDKAQSLIQRWQAEIASVKILEDAQLVALSGSAEDLVDAINMARQIPRSSDKWDAAGENISDWTSQMERIEDRPVLDLADELSVPGDETALRSAIAQARKIGPGRIMFEEAQSRIRYWQSRLTDMREIANYQTPTFQRPVSFDTPTFTDLDAAIESEPIEPSPIAPNPIESQPTASGLAEPSSVVGDLDPATPDPTPSGTSLLSQAQQLAADATPAGLKSAMEKANQVPSGSFERSNADFAIESWGRQILAQAAAQADVDPQQAIAIAQLIPGYSSAYSQAQELIQSLSQRSSELTPPP